jgi:hypothetical protein
MAFEAFISFRSLRNPGGCHFRQGNTEIVPPSFKRFGLCLCLFLEIEEQLLAFAGWGQLSGYV